MLLDFLKNDVGCLVRAEFFETGYLPAGIHQGGVSPQPEFVFQEDTVIDMKFNQPGFFHVGNTGLVSEGHVCCDLVDSGLDGLWEFFCECIQIILTKNESSRRFATGRIFYVSELTI